jgi:hypothetical protein
MLAVRSRPNYKKRNPSLAHLRACVVDSLLAPEPMPGRYEKELADYQRDNLTPYLKPTAERKPETVGVIRV